MTIANRAIAENGVKWVVHQEKDILLPPAEQPLELNTDEHEFILNVDKEKLETAEGFDQNNWPDMTSPEWGSRIYSHYGYQPYWEV